LRKYSKTAPKLRLKIVSKRLKLKNSMGAKSEKNTTEAFINLPITSKERLAEKRRLAYPKSHKR
jgi:hypothetical protein